MTYAQQAALYNEIQETIDEAARNLDGAQANRTAFLQSIVGVKVGDIISTNSQELRVTRVNVQYMHPDPRKGAFTLPTIWAVKKKKDGTWSIRELQIWQEWRVVTPAPALTD